MIPWPRPALATTLTDRLPTVVFVRTLAIMGASGGAADPNPFAEYQPTICSSARQTAAKVD